MTSNYQLDNSAQNINPTIDPNLPVSLIESSSTTTQITTDSQKDAQPTDTAIYPSDSTSSVSVPPSSQDLPEGPAPESPYYRQEFGIITGLSIASAISFILAILQFVFLFQSFGQAAAEGLRDLSPYPGYAVFDSMLLFFLSGASITNIVANYLSKGNKSTLFAFLTFSSIAGSCTVGLVMLEMRAYSLGIVVGTFHTFLYGSLISRIMLAILSLALVLVIEFLNGHITKRYPDLPLEEVCLLSFPSLSLLYTFIYLLILSLSLYIYISISLSIIYIYISLLSFFQNELCTHWIQLIEHLVWDHCLLQ